MSPNKPRKIGFLNSKNVFFSIFENITKVYYIGTSELPDGLVPSAELRAPNINKESANFLKIRC